MTDFPKRLWPWAVLLLGGCVHVPDQGTERPPIKYDVQCGGDCLQLKTSGAADRSALLAKVGEHLQAGRLASAELLLERRLDVALEALRRRDARQAPTQAELLAARVIDRKLQHAVDEGWEAHIVGRGRGGVQRVEAMLARADELERLRQWVALRDLVRQNELTLASYPYHAVHAGLLLVEAERRLGAFDAASQSWQQTASQGARLVSACPAPALWEEIAARRPVSTPWPGEVGAVLAPLVPPCLSETTRQLAFTSEALVWFAIGKARLERAEAALALTAFKHADSQGHFPDWDDFLALYQAKALLGLDQAPAAISVLNALAMRPPASPWRLPALALLGSVKLHEGQTQHALVFLRQAVEESSTEFLARTEAEADLGLTYLSLGDEAQGLARLHSAQESMQSERRLELLLTCLANEAAYLEAAGRPADAQTIKTRIGALQARGTDRGRVVAQR